MEWLLHRGKKGILSKAAKGLVLLSLFLSVLALANSLTLHKALHLNAATAEHHCVVTLLASGQVDVASGFAALVAPSPILISFVFPDLSFETGPSFNLPLSRGPPALLS